ncbi:MAG: putative hydroxymethylpyrimidine transporter CytX [Candidatus Korarchaeota archaeon]|nr:putative hydroxymethylpyrimidine transporter CytX [Candidatus Korarchaeota archaeon]NIU84779.1 putative hydroxymethylpyrimidine transporter CytX [Candidatus Thorarchaeota archaeon]NIW14773.1 putative hydroxymethylpyrimidine transporter CytX [Candidatus Thorarchaeota archaeon]NIW51503.1 putative hydroxymethylpyrimidine transporter CytX [Candidatus Korarchaeota archaeon]
MGIPLVEEPPEWGIEPVPEEKKTLGFLDYFVLWSSLGVGLLVFQAGAELGLGLLTAIIVSILGSILGSLMLASAGLIGSKYGVPTMVSVRPALGRWGSYLPTALNVIQLIGWTAFEFIVMKEAATTISGPFLGRYTEVFWAIIIAIFCWLLAYGGPITVVRKWLEKFAIWLVFASTIWITVYLITEGWNVRISLTSVGSIPFFSALDLVIAMPISWMPLVNDYNRFAENDKQGFFGTFSGYTLTNTWFYSLGAALVVLTDQANVVVAISSILLGGVALALIIVDETDNAFADIFSTGMSIKNLFPNANQRTLVTGATAIGLIIVLMLPLGQYINFLYLIGGFFVPLFGVVIADFLVVKRTQYKREDFYGEKKLDIVGIISWVSGATIYFTITYLFPQINLPSIGASLPSFLVAFLVHYLLSIAKRS